MYREKDHCRA